MHNSGNQGSAKQDSRKMSSGQRLLSRPANVLMHYDLSYFDDEMCRLEPIQNPFGPTVLPMSSE